MLQAARRIAVGLPEAETVLAIQGPPGTGKTYTGGRMIVELVRAGRRVGISAQAHKAITNLLRETVEAAREAGVPLRALQRIDGGEAADELAEVTEATNTEIAQALADGTVDVVAGTCWLFARSELERTHRRPVHRRSRPAVARQRGGGRHGGPGDRPPRRSRTSCPR